MRIRKRKVPLPISLLSPVPLSDPHLFSRSPVTLLLQGETANTTTHAANDADSSQPLDHLLASDLHRLIDGNNSGSKSNSDGDDVVKSGDPLVKEQEEQLLGCCLGFKLAAESISKSNDASNHGITALGATAATNGPSPFSNHAERAMWLDEDKAIPLKKRRGSFEGANTIVVDLKPEADEKQLLINCSSNEEMGDYDHNHGEEKAISNAKSSRNEASTRKGGKRGKTIMEGSRCSRVNGRGWRCCQPTLVGYSLCEHHLGKGRLRSVTNVRGRPSVSKKAALGGSNGIESSPLLQLCEAAKKESEALASNERKALAMVKSSTSTVGKRVKLGVVKARSLSSLLGQANITTSSNSITRMDVSTAALDYETSNDIKG